MSLKHAQPRHIHVPDKSKQEPNWQEVEKFSRATQNGPSAVQFTGDPGTILSTGAFKDIVWTPNADPRLDQYHFLTIPNGPNIRIPIDGYYDCWFSVSIADVPTANGYIEARAVHAGTSDSGFAAPVFVVLGPRTSMFMLNGWAQGINFTVVYRGLELHANDLLKFQLRILSQAANFNTTIIPAAEFRYSYPIPDGR